MAQKSIVVRLDPEHHRMLRALSLDLKAAGDCITMTQLTAMALEDFFGKVGNSTSFRVLRKNYPTD